MKLTARLVIVLLLLVAPVLAPPVAAAETNLFTNGDFESGTDGWRLFDMAQQTTLALDTKKKAEGKASLRIERASSRGAAFVKQFVDLPAGVGELRVRLRYRVDKGAQLKVTLFFAVPDAADENAHLLVDSGRTKRFESVEQTLAVPAGATRVGMDLSMASDGTAWVDAVEVLCDLPEGLADPGCERGAAGWGALLPGTGTAALAADGKVKSEGKASLRVDRTSFRRFPEDGAFADARGDVVGKKTARVEVAVRTDGATRAAVVLQAFDAAGRCLATRRSEATHPAERFGDVVAAVELPDGVVLLRVSLVVSGRGAAWFDDVRLETK